MKHILIESFELSEIKGNKSAIINAPITARATGITCSVYHTCICDVRDISLLILMVANGNNKAAT